MDTLHPKAFYDLPGLVKLWLAEVKITEIKAGIFVNLPKLKFIDLSRNMNLITLHPKAFYDLPGLVKLDLRSTGITEIEANKLLNLQNTEILVGVHEYYEFEDEDTDTDEEYSESE